MRPPNIGDPVNQKNLTTHNVRANLVHLDDQIELLSLMYKVVAIATYPGDIVGIHLHRVDEIGSISAEIKVPKDSMVKVHIYA